MSGLITVTSRSQVVHSELPNSTPPRPVCREASYGGKRTVYRRTNRQPTCRWCRDALGLLAPGERGVSRWDR